MRRCNSLREVIGKLPERICANVRITSCEWRCIGLADKIRSNDGKPCLSKTLKAFGEALTRLSKDSTSVTKLRISSTSSAGRSSIVLNLSMAVVVVGEEYQCIHAKPGEVSSRLCTLYLKFDGCMSLGRYRQQGRAEFIF